MNNLSLYIEILLPAFCAGLLVLSTHIFLGREVLKRGIIFLDLAVAQIAGMGIILAGLLGFAQHGWELQAVAFASAITGAALLGFAEKRVRANQEAIIGCVFILAATGSLLLLSNNPQGGEHLQEVLLGQILWVQWQELIFPMLCSIVIILLCIFRPSIFQSKLFYLIFAIAITNAVQLVGVYLVFACLIMPALCTRKLDNKWAMPLSFIVGALSFFAGLLISTIADLPTGAVIVWVMALVSIVFVLLLNKIKVSGAE